METVEVKKATARRGFSECIQTLQRVSKPVGCRFLTYLTIVEARDQFEVTGDSREKVSRERDEWLNKPYIGNINW